MLTSRTIPPKETLTVEFKRDKKKYGDADLFEDMLAFANTDGGDLYLDVEDEGEITSVQRITPTPLPCVHLLPAIRFLQFPHGLKSWKKDFLF